MLRLRLDNSDDLRRDTECACVWLVQCVDESICSSIVSPLGACRRRLLAFDGFSRLKFSVEHRNSNPAKSREPAPRSFVSVCLSAANSCEGRRSELSSAQPFHSP
jgi:hypothetical protein